MRIREMEMLIRVAETGSMTIAAKQLHMSPAAVSAAVQRLEESLSVLFFERTTRTLKPTDAGVLIVDRCIEIVSRWHEMLDEVQGQESEIEGEVRISAPADTTYSIVQDVVAELTVEHPLLRIVMDTSDAIQQLHRDGIDLAIRYGPLDDSGLTVRKLASSPRVLVATNEYLARLGTPSSPDDLAAHRCLTLRLSGAPVTKWTMRNRLGKSKTVLLDSALCGDGFLVRRWALSGMGIAYKSLFDVIDDLEAGRLSHVLPDWSGGEIAMHVVFPSRRFLPRRVRRVEESIAGRFLERSQRCERWLDRID